MNITYIGDGGPGPKSQKKFGVEFPLNKAVVVSGDWEKKYLRRFDKNSHFKVEKNKAKPKAKKAAPPTLVPSIDPGIYSDPPVKHPFGRKDG